MKRGKILCGLASLFSAFLPSVGAQLTAEQQALVLQAQAQAAAAGTNLGTVGSITGTAFIISVVIGLAVYAYFAMAIMTIAKKTNTPRAWMAWVPFADFWLLKEIAQAPLWTFIVMLVGIIPVAFNLLPIIGWIMMLAMFTFWFWKICPRMNRPVWWVAILSLPFLGPAIATLTTNASINITLSIASLLSAVFLGIMAWGNAPKKATPPVPLEDVQKTAPAAGAEPSLQPVSQPVEPMTSVPVQQ